MPRSNFARRTHKTEAPGAQSITDELGNDRLGDRSGGSFLNFFLDAGANVIKVTGTGQSASTQFRIRYYSRYIAI